jgi:acyl CoA:acetate/3-ketoacid CoA transferase beta subunit
MPDPQYTSDEMMTIAAARMVRNGAALFVGIGLPSAAANVALRTHAPETILIYESGTIGSRPAVLPLSIGDGELAETADAVVSVPEMFAYWLQGGKIDLGFLGAAQIDKYANINTTVIGPYDKPKVRLPGAGGAPEIAASCKEVLITLRQNNRAFVEKLDFVTSPGHLDGGTSREKLRRYVAELEERNVRNDPGVRRWEYAKRTVLGLLLVFAILQFYFSDTLLQMLQLGGSTDSRARAMLLATVSRPRVSASSFEGSVGSRRSGRSSAMRSIGGPGVDTRGGRANFSSGTT